MSEEIHVCVEHDPRSVAGNAALLEQNVTRVFHAFRERPDNLTSGGSGRHALPMSGSNKALTLLVNNSDLHSILAADHHERTQVAELVTVIEKKWMNGKRLRVLFLEGTDLQKAMVRKYAATWMEHANIHFEFVDQGPAEIRIAFKLGAGSWSTMGTDCYLETDQLKPTMNYGWFTPDTQEEEYRRTIVHEFGHTIGFGHEQCSPLFAFTWKKEVVYDWYKREAGWSKEMVDDNVFYRYPSQEVDASAYDTRSIMQYPIPRAFTMEGVEIGWNTELSPTDIAWAKKHYPFPA